MAILLGSGIGLPASAALNLAGLRVAEIIVGSLLAWAWPGRFPGGRTVAGATGDWRGRVERLPGLRERLRLAWRPARSMVTATPPMPQLSVSTSSITTTVVAGFA